MTQDRKAIFATLVNGCMESEFKQMTCPNCGSSLKLRVHEDQRTFFVRCIKDSTHLSKHDVCLNPPEWFRAMATGLGWY